MPSRLATGPFVGRGCDWTGSASIDPINLEHGSLGDHWNRALIRPCSKRTNHARIATGSRHPLDDSKISLKDRFLGCLLGLAVGDALGMPVEGWTSERINATFGWLDHYEPRRDAGGEIGLERGEITGDTEMALCLVEGLISAGGFVDPEAIGLRLVKIAERPGPDLLGKTTRQSIERMAETGEYQQGGSGAWPPGSGAAARSAPLGLLHAVGRFNPEVFTREILRAGLITHRETESLNGALAFAYAVRLTANDEIPPEMLLAEVATFVDEDAIARKIRQAERLVPSGGDQAADLRNLQQLGTSEYVAEAVAAALYCFATHPDDFCAAVLAAVNVGGDTDTIAAMAGALVGARVGARALPPDLVDGLESRMYILVAAPGLYRMAQRRAGMFLKVLERQ
jgi:ADP-ribosylglycohydrolase